MRDRLDLMAGLLPNLVLLACFGAVVRAARTRRWPRCEGVVLGSRLLQTPDWDRTNYSADIRYRYVVGDTPYESTTIACLYYGSNFEKPARRRVAKFPVGARVTVHYHPHRPGVAVLEPGVRPFHVATLLVLAVSIYLWVPVGLVPWLQLFGT